MPTKNEPTIIVPTQTEEFREQLRERKAPPRTTASTSGVSGTRHDSDNLPPVPDSLLDAFLALSQDLTGVSELDRALACNYYRRVRENETWIGSLDELLKIHQSIRRQAVDCEEQIAARIMAVEHLRRMAQQIIYLWYLSAFFQDRFDNVGEPRKTGEGVWRFGTWEQYECGLAWAIMNAHPPMIRGGGEFGDWAKPPSRPASGE